VLLEVAARILLDYGVEMLVRGCDGVERVDGRGTAVVRDRVVVEYFEEDFGGQRIERGHGAHGCWMRVRSCVGCDEVSVWGR